MRKLTQKEFDKLLAIVDNEVRDNKYMRRGQSLYNHLHDINPELANSINNTELDPFYVQSRIPTFLEFILEPQTTEE